MPEQEHSPARVTELATELQAELQKFPGYHSIGVGEGKIFVYVRSEEDLKDIPEHYQGVAIQASVIGEIVPG